MPSVSMKRPLPASSAAAPQVLAAGASPKAYPPSSLSSQAPTDYSGRQAGKGPGGGSAQTNCRDAPQRHSMEQQVWRKQTILEIAVLVDGVAGTAGPLCASRAGSASRCTLRHRCPTIAVASPLVTRAGQKAASPPALNTAASTPIPRFSPPSPSRLPDHKYVVNCSLQ